MFKPKILPLKKGQYLIVCPNGDIFIDNEDCVKEARLYSDRGGLRININGKLVHLGRFIAQQFLPNPLKFKWVVHKDGNKANNHVNNLMWTKNLKQHSTVFEQSHQLEYQESLSKYKAKILDFSDRKFYVFPNGKIFVKYNGKILMKKPFLVLNRGAINKKLRIYIGSKHFSVAHLVATFFLENPNRYRYVKHLDGNTLNNDVSNLSWEPMSFHISPEKHEYYNSIDVSKFNEIDKMVYKVYKDSDDSDLRLWFLSDYIHKIMKYIFLRHNKYENPEELDFSYDKLVNLIKKAKVIPPFAHEKLLISLLNIIIRYDYLQRRDKMQMVSFNDNYHSNINKF